MSDRYRQAGGLRDFDLLAFWAMLVVLIFYPLSPEIIVFGDQVQSEPKLFDAFWAWIFPVFFLFFSLRDRNAASILGWVCFVLSIIVLFILQMQATAGLGLGVPNVGFALRYLQYSTYFMFFLVAVRVLSFQSMMILLFILNVLLFMAFLYNFVFVPDALNRNIIATFRGSHDAGSFFVMLLALFIAARRRIIDTFGLILMIGMFGLVAINIVLSSSRTALVVAIFVALVPLFRRPLLLVSGIAALSGGVSFLYTRGLLAGKVTRLLDIVFYDPLNQPQVVDRSIEMRMENVDRFVDFMDQTGWAPFLTLLGSGPGYFQNFVSLYGLPGTFDSFPLRVFAEYGLLGLCGFMSVLAVIGRYSLVCAFALFLLSLTGDVLVMSKVVPLIALIFAVGFVRPGSWLVCGKANLLGRRGDRIPDERLAARRNQICPSEEQ